MTKVRVSGCGALMWDSGHLVWEDFLEHRRATLPRGVERLLRWFTEFRELDSAAQIDPGGDQWERLAAALLERSILIEHGSKRHRCEQEIEAAWGDWGLLAKAYHFSSRTDAQAPYVRISDEEEMLEAKAATDPPPPAFPADPGLERIPLPVADSGVWQKRGLLQVLYARRSRRDFAAEPLPLSTLAALLKTAVGALPRRPGKLTLQTGPAICADGVLTDSWQRVFKTSPSGGARHSTETYAYVRNVTGLEPGAYHYLADRHTLTSINRKVSDEELIAACGDQDWVGGASVLLFYTSVIARTQWKYDYGRVYRTLFMDVGHISQTVYLLATAAGLHVTYTAALRDELVERLLGCDPVRQVVLGSSVIGTAPAVRPEPG